MPNGILLYGPPGCGKTYLARRLAEKIGYGFCEVRLSAIAGPLVHQTAVGIGLVFENAAKDRPMLLFLDEVDSLGTDRKTTGVAAYRLEEVNELLKQMDRCHERGILVIAACNALDRVDPAIRRPGRLDKQIFIGPPDAAAREDLFRHYLKGKPVAENIDYDELVKRSEGYSIADIEAVVKEAAKIAAIQDAPAINGRHLHTALEVIPSSLGIADKRRSKQIGFSSA